MNSVDIKDAKNLLFAGKAILTFQSTATQNHYTYKITKAKDKELWFCSLLNGPDNYANYQYIGVIDNGKFRTTKASKIDAKALSILAFNYTVVHLLKGDLTDVNIFHEGRCCRCGKRLTTPESIKSGIGPICANL